MKLTMTYMLKNTVFRIGILLLVLILPMAFFLHSQQEHKKIVEEVSVSWWQVPVFAVDKDGIPITDLKPGDIEVRLNGQQVPAFTLYKRSFSVTKRGKKKEAEESAAKQQPIKKKKVVFFLFDQALSGKISTRRAKKIAKKIVMDAQEEVRFFVMTIDAFAGLAYVGGGSGSSKDQLVKLIEKDVKEKQNKRIIDASEFMVNLEAANMNENKYDPSESQLFIETESRYFKRKSMGFFYSFETLYFFLNSIEENKFIYFFSEGMSQSILTTNQSDFGSDGMATGRGLFGPRGMYYNYFKKAAKYLNRSGAVLFVINAMGVDQYHSSITRNQLTENSAASTSKLTGENSLDLLARESGGTYLEGTNEKIVEQLENMHRAYYEISFPDFPQLKGPTRKISIKSGRKGIKLHSPNTLEKRKQYDQMSSIEKEMLVINIVTQPDNSLIKNKIAAYNAPVYKTKKSKKGVTYTLKLPPGFLHRPIELYKVWLTVDEQEIARVEKIEKESLSPKKDSLKIQFLFTPNKKKKGKNKEKTKDETRTYFVLVNRGQEPVRALVHGIELYDRDPELLELEKKKTALKAKKSGKAISEEKMNQILQGAADYCQRLKESAFHFYCREKIIETRIPLTGGKRKELNIDEARKNTGTRVRNSMTGVSLTGSRGISTQVKSYLFGYRLIKQGNKINEQRDWISSDDNLKLNRNQLVKASSFFSEKAVFAPITILDRSRQDKYDFQFIKYHQRNGRPIAVIKALPKNPGENSTIYGTLWIDMEDFSLLKIEAHPKSIRGYGQLKKLAKKMRTRLYLSLEIDFDLRQKGIRFPTSVSFLEKYKGGRIISGHRGPKGWERTRTRFNYFDYQFFVVKTEVTIQETGGNKQ